ncbi:flagellar basal body P-ring formation chaperone FlgA [Maritalea mediterranea]|uniref:Flagellar basal body P-ring formation chaperone FlgA n=1 Tax=Maritalea mediterranea TaxID=2909667 RepID=A0ABS9E7F3_9HYPH|nr:flagellar basal body P-ring formation chaperone FlgA [Maritalea mediterranea]MCF4098815.1 flagellar basal body P-ring formation chaperone FlgA [Maritalea mediterranea]
MFKTLTKTALVLATSLLAQNAWATPVLKPSIIVDTKIVTVGDMFDNAGIHAETALFRSPAPGTVGAVPLASVQLAAQRAGLENYDTAGLSQVRVERAGIKIDNNFVAQLVNEELAARQLLLAGETAQVRLNTGLNKLFADSASDNPVMVLDFEVGPQTRTFTARLALAGHRQPLQINGRIDILIEAPFVATSKAKGEILKLSDIEMRPASEQVVRAQGSVQIEDLVGKSLTRSLRGGSPIRMSDVTEPDVINRNDLVTLYFKKGALTLTVKAKALQSAAIDEPVTVLNLMSNKPIQGIVTGAGAVAIPTGPAKIATAN